MKIGAAMIGFAAMPLFGGPGLGGPVRLQAVDRYGAYVGGYMRAVDFCDAFGCESGQTYGIYGEISGYNVITGEFGGTLADDGFDTDGTTDGGLKDTEVVGTLSFRLNSLRADGLSGFSIDSYANATLFIGGDLYAAEVTTEVNIEIAFSLVGLPNDRFVRADLGGGTFVGTSEYGPEGQVLAGGVLTPGAFGFQISDFDARFYQCPVCPRDPLRDGDDGATGNGERGGAQISSSASVFVSPTFELSGEAQWLQFDAGLAARAWVIEPIENGSELLVAGIFEDVGGEDIVRVTSWDGTAWKPYGSGTNGGVRAAVEWNNGLVIGGGFTRAGGQLRSRVAFWDGDSWEALGEGFNGVVRALEVVNGVLYAGGEYTMSGEETVQYLARWDSGEQQWFEVIDVNGPVHAMHQPSDPAGIVFFSDTLVIGGDFTQIDGNNARSVAVIEDVNGSFPSCYVLDGGVQGVVNSIASDVEWDPDFGEYYPRLYVGGSFSQVGSPIVNAANVARFDWTDYQWFAMGDGVNDNVNDVYVYDSDAGQTRGFGEPQPSGGSVVLVGGDFTQAGGAPAPRIARWDEGTWSPMGDGFNRFVSAIGMWQDEVIASGKFDATGSFNALHLARWTLDDPPAPACPGDASGDNAVDFSDLNAVLVAFGQSGAPGFTPADLDGDGSVGFSDLNAVLALFGTSCD